MVVSCALLASLRERRRARHPGGMMWAGLLSVNSWARARYAPSRCQRTLTRRDGACLPGPDDPVHVVRPEHCQMPVLRGVARLALTPATPGLRRAMDQRLDLIRHHATVHRRLLMTAGGCDT